MKDITNVIKPHSILTAKMDLSPREQDLLTILMLSIKKEHDANIAKYGNEAMAELNTPTIFKYRTSELVQLLGLNKARLSHKDKETGRLELDMSCKALWERGIERREGNNFVMLRLLSYAKFDGRELTLEVPSVVRKEMIDYSKGGMGIVDYKLLISLRGKYDKRILELISRFKNKREFQCKISELCEMLGTDLNQYKDWRSFSSSVLVTPIQRIIKQSNGMWEAKGNTKGFEIRKKGLEKSYNGDDVIIFKMKYLASDTGASKFKSLYKNIMEGKEVSKKQLDEVLTKINEYDLEDYQATPDFIKMWAACSLVASS